MLIQKIVKHCNNDYRNNKDICDCSYGTNCPKICSKCLEYVHFPQKAPKKRNYDCKNMADFYVCKYSAKYTSEIIYALELFTDLKDLKKIKVMSIGCGPCTDLFALDYMNVHSIYKYKEVKYRGIDYGDLWKTIYKEIQNHMEGDIKFYYEDAFSMIDRISSKRWKPDLLVLQYVLSDMRKNKKSEEISEFISKLANFINLKMPYNSYIIINDINLQNCQGGGRDYFEELVNKLEEVIFYRKHFDNSTRDNHYDYGEEYDSNKIKFELHNLDGYEPFITCSSAQLLIKKVKE